MMNDTKICRAASYRILRTTKRLIQHVLAVTGFTLLAGQSAFAQAVVAPSCPPGYTLSGGNCVLGAPAPTCPPGYTLSGGQCIANVVAPTPSRPAAPPAEGSTAWEVYDCDGLWRTRNGIYASKGYCFKTARAKREFPHNCFPPYGKLSASEKKEVAVVKKWEKIKGCR